MSLSLILEKYDVSTEEGLQKALSEIEKEEVSVQLIWWRLQFLFLLLFKN